MPRRHDLLRVRPDIWPDVVARSPYVDALTGEPRRLVTNWAERGWPVIVRRRTPEEDGTDIPIGLPLPPACGKLRLGLSVPAGFVLESLAAVPLSDARASAPASWLPQVDGLIALGERLALPPAVFGALLWQHLTGLPYLRPGSDIDLLWPMPPAAALAALLDGIERLDLAGPTRLDGEILLSCGSGVNWRELQRELRSAGGAVLVKSMDAAELRNAHALFA